MPMLTGSWKIPNFRDSEWMKTPKTDLPAEVKEGKELLESISLDSRLVNLENAGFPATLNMMHLVICTSNLQTE